MRVERGKGTERNERPGKEDRGEKESGETVGPTVSGVNLSTELVGESKRNYFSQNTRFSILQLFRPYILISFPLAI